jgi:hypothetical protein
MLQCENIVLLTGEIVGCEIHYSNSIIVTNLNKLSFVGVGLKMSFSLTLTLKSPNTCLYFI